MDDSSTFDSTFDDIRAEIERARRAVDPSTDGPPGFQLLPPDPGIRRLAQAIQELASAMEKLSHIVEASTERRGDDRSSSGPPPA